MVRIEGAGDTFTGVSGAQYADGTDWYCVQIGEIRDGRVWRLQTFWAETFEAPAWRSSIVERIQATEKSTAK